MFSSRFFCVSFVFSFLHFVSTLTLTLPSPRSFLFLPEAMSQARPAALHFVRLVRSPIGQTEEVRRTLKVLQLNRLQATAIHKNTPSVNGMLRSVMHLVKLKPLRFDKNTPPPEGHGGYGPYLTDDGVVLGASEEDFLSMAEGGGAKQAEL